jgi:gliding motility-associated lipoprotein GldH
MRPIIFIIVVVLLTSCDTRFIYGEDYDVDELGWHQDSVYVFETDSLTKLPPLITIGFNIRNTTDYLYRNMYLFVEIQIPGREKPIKDTLDHILMTPDGYWVEGVQGASIKESMAYLKDKEVELKESIAYYPYAIQNPERGVYRIKVQQGMRDEVLKDVVSIGARIEKLDP